MKKHIITTDGACRGNGKSDNYGSWAFIVLDENKNIITQESMAEKETTNNKMELTAALKGLEYILNTNDKNIEYTIKIDSNYVFNSITLGWAYNWKKRNFIIKGSEYRPNWEIWNEVLQVIDKINIGGLKMSWDKVEGHEDYYNILVDTLCNTTMDQFKSEKKNKPAKKISLNKIDSEEFFNIDNDFCYDAIKTDYKENTGIQMISESDLSEDQKNGIFKVTNWYKNHRHESQVFTFGGAAGVGKCLDVNSLIITNDGYKKIGEAQVGDMIYSIDGKLCQITGVFPQEEKKTCYNIIFNDGTEIICDAEQLFSYYTDDMENSEEFKTTLFSEILSKYCSKDNNIYTPNKKINFPITKPLRFKENSVSIDPLLAGVLLGVGCNDFYFNDSDFVMHLSKITLNNDNIVDEISNIMIRHNYILSSRNFNRGVLSYVFNTQKQNNDFKTKMIASGLLDSSRIPNEYLIAPFRTKIKFLEGFLVSKLNSVNDFNVSIKNNNKIEDFKFIIQSLGGIVLLDENTKNSVFRQCTICLSSIFTDKPSNLLNRYIKTIEKLEEKLDTICIKVDHPTELFLSNDCLVVHNTSVIPHIINQLNLTMPTGKAQPVDLIIPTPNGPKRFGDLKINDYVFDKEGKPTKILGIYPKGQLDSYKITLADGRVTYSCKEHLWNCYKNNQKIKTVMLEEIFQDYKRKENNRENRYIYKYAIPMNDPVEYKEQNLIVDPYVVGCFIGDGCLTSKHLDFSSGDSKIPEMIADILNFRCEKAQGNHWIFRPIEKQFRQNGTEIRVQQNEIFGELPSLFGKNSLEKLIPNQYLYSSFQQRFALLQGLFDTDGCISKTGCITFSNTNLKLIQQIQSIIFSLGYSATISEESRRRENRNICYTLLVNIKNSDKYNFFRLDRKKEIALSFRNKKNFKRYDRLTIRDIQLDKKEEMMCIKVDNHDELYLTNDYIVTHNTGHSLPYNAKVLKKNGFVPIGSCKVNDEICGGNGEFCKITGIFPQGKRNMFKVKFSDGTSTICDGEHLWTVAAPNEKFVVKTLNQIREEGLRTTKGRIKFRIPIVQPVQFPERKLPIDPYLLGVLLNGTFDIGDAITIRTKHQETLPKVKQILARMNFKLGPARQEDVDGIAEYYVLSKVDTIKDNILNSNLHELGLKGLNNEQKFIPPIYLHGSINQRRELLNGLINISGFFVNKSANKLGNKSSFAVEFMSKSLQYLKDIRFLVQSLGGLAELHEVSDVESTESFKGWHRLSVKIRSFKMDIQNKEFLNNCNLNKVLLTKNIIEIEDLQEEQEAICIKVDDPFELFVTNDFIVTHNTNVMSNIAYATYTGKASMVLQRKGIPSKTIHSLIYDASFNKKTKKFIFSKKPLKELQYLKLIIIDEFSMVSEEIMKDLLSYNIPILMFGDPYQLPPIGSPNSFMNNLDVCLTKIHRQAEDNPILVLATKIRNGENIQYGDWGRAKVLQKSMLTKEIMFNANQVLCGKNNTRHDINDSFRRNLGFVDLQPKLGEKIICLSNNWGMSIMDFFLVNGMVGNITDIGFDLHGRPVLDFQPEFLNQSFLKVLYDEDIFFRKEKDKNNWRYSKELNEFDFGYCITVHKCVSEDTWIYTDKGIKQIKELDNGASINEFKPILEDIKVFNGEFFEAPSHFYNNGIDDVNHIITDRGYEIKITNQHKCYILDEYGNISEKLANELKIDDILLIRKNQNISSNNIIDFSITNKDIYNKQDIRSIIYKLPDQLTPELGRIIGYLCADGFITRGASYSKSHKECVEDFADKFNNIFNTQIEVKEKENYFTAEINSTLIRDFFMQFPELHPDNKSIPRCIMQSSIEIQIEFLRGFFEDGTVHLKNGKFDMIDICFKNEQMLSQIQQLLLNLGIEATYGLRKTKKNEKYPLYKCYIFSKGAMIFKEKIGFISKFKQERLLMVDFKYEKRGSESLAIKLSNILKANKFYHKYLDNIRSSLNLTETNFNKIYNILPEHISSLPEIQKIKILFDDFIFEKIISIEKEKNVQTYCLTMPETHKFIQNGFYLGNSQGSQWDKVVVWEEVLRAEQHRKWLYTAVTRPSEELVVFH